MKHSKKKTSLLTGLILIITGAGGIGYIPGKPMVLTVVCAMVMIAGILMAASFSGRHKNSRSPLNDRSRRMTAAPARRKNYSQYAA